jgi:hypothetical protein
VLLAASPAFGCGYCIEDKVAAVYDHGVITAALDRHHQMAFFAIEGTLPTRGESRRIFAKALLAAKGIDASSLRVSMDSASLSLSYDDKRISSDRIMRILNRKLAARGLSVSLLEVKDQRAAGN